MIGDKYGLLTIIEDLGCINKHRRVLVECGCGIKKLVRLASLRSGNTKSCGCMERGNGHTLHGMYNHPLNRVWNEMKQRCNNPNDKNFYKYGARGIQVCGDWMKSFKVFYDWSISSGWNRGLEIDRIDNDGNYEPGNCRFVTPKINCRNKRNNVLITYKAETKCLSEWCEMLNINRGTLIDRLFVNNWQVEKAFTQPVRKIKWSK